MKALFCLGAAALMLCEAGCRNDVSERESKSAPQKVVASQPTTSRATPSPAKKRTKAEELSHQLGYAARGGSAKDVRRLLAQGTDPNKPSKDNGYPLAQAVFFSYEGRHLDAVGALVEGGANPNQVSPIFSRLATPLEIALGNNEGGGPDEAVALYLVRAGADVNQALSEKSNGDGTTSAGGRIIHMAAGRGQGKVISALVAKGADVDARDALSRTPLMFAIAWEYRGSSPDDKWFLQTRHEVQAVKALIQAGADVNARDRQGRTPLLRALSSPTILETKYRARMLQVVKALLSAGAKVDVAANDGSTPIQLARKNNYRQTLALLLSHR